METRSTCVSVTPLDNVVGMQQNIANPVRCIVVVNIKHTLKKKKKKKMVIHENRKSMRKLYMYWNLFTSDKFTRKELKSHNKLSKKGCKQQNRGLQLYIITEEVSKLMPNRSMGPSISNSNKWYGISYGTISWL